MRTRVHFFIFIIIIPIIITPAVYGWPAGRPAGTKTRVSTTLSTSDWMSIRPPSPPGEEHFLCPRVLGSTPSRAINSAWRTWTIVFPLLFVVNHNPLWKGVVTSSSLVNQGNGGVYEPKFETVTRETVETFRGNRTQKVVTSEKRDVLDNFSQDLTNNLQEISYDGTSKNGGTPVREPLSARNKTPSPETTPADKSKSESKFGGLFKSKPKSESDSAGAEGDFATDCLRAHNDYRRRHGVEPLKLNKKICKYSEEWAKYLASRGIMEHRQNNEYGENIFCSWSSNANYKVTGTEPVDNWYSEIKDHLFGREPRDLKSGHFTQVVWKGSKELGVAVAKSRNGQIFVVANYSPPGNFIGSFAVNVPPPIGPGSPTTNGVPAITPTPVKTKPEPVSSSDKSFEEEGLRLANALIVLSSTAEDGKIEVRISMCTYATDWAKTLAKEDRFGHRPDSKYGENIYCMWSSDPAAKVTAKDACDSWYKEIKDHIFGVEPRMLKSGHFTQMIWKGSQELGIGLAKSKNGRTLIVANYHPRGNCIGQFAVNVPRPR
uniref:(California timema) hypothetical protein n=1 Tax=Timema californicum TaxID=61474 RepID=A0A7R9P4K3_TIMCA|nr:unnamed protein product [Timema californicum]